MEHDQMKANVLARAAELFATHEVSQRQLAKIAGVPYHKLRRCLDHRNESMTTKSICLLASVLGVKPHELTVP